MSWQLSLVTLFSRLLVKPALSRATDPIKARNRFDKLANKVFRKPPYLYEANDLLSFDNQDVPALWVSIREPKRKEILFYAHGGGYIMGSPQTHKGMVGYLLRTLGMQAIMPDYRLAPEAKFPSGLDDVISSYLALLERGYCAKEIILGGESAGGNLVFGLLAHLQKHKMPLPKAVFTISPNLDLTFSSPSCSENAKSDAVLDVTKKERLQDLYLAKTPPEDPKVSPLFAEFEKLTPVLFQASTGEILRGDSEFMADKLAASGTDVEVKLWKSDIHVFHILVGWVPEARHALVEVSDFIRQQINMTGDS